MRMSYKNGTTKGKTPTTPKEKKLAALAEPKNKITFGDVVAGRKKAMGGGMMRKQFGKGGGAGLYANIAAKKARIKAGSGEKMAKKGSKKSPTAKNFKDAAKTAKA